MKILFLNRSYWPDAEATGQQLTELCEDLAPYFDITVIAGQPNQNPEGIEFKRRGTETHNGVTIRRVRHTQFAKSSMLGKAINFVTYLIGASWSSLWVKNVDAVVVETDPPLLCLLGWFLRPWHRAKLVVYLQDIYPDIAVALGKLRNGVLTRLLRKLMFGVYKRADRVIVLSRDMRDLLVDAGVPADRIEIIPNWTDTSVVYPIKENNLFREAQNLNGQFVVMYSGNLGLCQRLDDVIAAAEDLRDRDDILFMLVGGGALKDHLEQQVAERGLTNVRFLPYQPKSQLAHSLSGADVHLIPLDPCIASCLMPSKLYGILASGTPVIAVAPEDTELAEVIRDTDVGVVAEPGEPAGLAELIRRLADETWDLADMGARARHLAESEYDRRHVTLQVRRSLQGVLDIPDTARPKEQPSESAYESASRADLL